MIKNYKCDVTCPLPPLPLSQTVTPSRTPSPLEPDVVDGRPLGPNSSAGRHITAYRHLGLRVKDLPITRSLYVAARGGVKPATFRTEHHHSTTTSIGDVILVLSPPIAIYNIYNATLTTTAIINACKLNAAMLFLFRI